MRHFLCSSVKYSTTDPRQKKITDALVSFIATDLLPLSLVESSSFRNLVGLLDPKYSVPSRKHFSQTLLTNKVSDVEKRLKTQLQQAQSVCLTIDLWSSRQMRGYMGVTGHFILNWTLHSVLLSCSRFHGRHTSDNISHHVEETLTCFEVATKISHVITDNASNMTKAFSLTGYESDEGTDEDDDTNDDSPEYVDINIDMTEAVSYKHHPCFTHTLQLVVKDGLSKSGQLSRVIAKASKLFASVRKSTYATELLEGEKRLQTSCETRWNSQLTMIRSVLAISPEKFDKLDCTKLTLYERKTLQEVVDMLTPFESATHFTQGENMVTSSLVVPCVKGMKKKLAVLGERYSCALMKTLKVSFERRMSHFEENGSLIMATISDPRFKLSWCSGAAYIMNKEQLQELAAAVQVETESGTDYHPPKKMKTDFIDLFWGSPENVSQSSEVEKEVSEYLSGALLEKDKNPLAYWAVKDTSYPRLARLAEKFIAMPASSAPVERIFSIGGKIFQPDRCRLPDSVFEKLMFLRCNRDIIN